MEAIFTSDKPALRWLWKVSGTSKGLVALLAVVQILLGLVGVALAWLLRGLIDSAVSAQEQAFIAFAAALVGLLLGRVALGALSRRLQEQSRSTLENRLKERLFAALMSARFSEVRAKHSGEWLNRLTSDTVVVANGLTDIVPGVSGMLAQLIGAVLLLVALMPGLGLVLVVFGILMLLASTLFRRRMKALHKRIQEADGALRVFLTEHLSSMAVVHAFSREEQARGQAAQRMEEHKGARMRRNAFSNTANTGFGLVMNGFYALGAIWCAWGILQGQVSYGTFVAVIQLVNQVQSPFANITGYMPRFYAVIASAERLMEAESFHQDAAGERVPADEVARFYEDELAAIELKDVCFKYEDGDVDDAGDGGQVLQGFSLTIEKGRQIALTGPSGRGKSTILKLLMGLYIPQAGSVELRTIGGERQLLDARWRGLFSYVPQGNDLMGGTIRQVVTFGEDAGTSHDGAIWNALSVACAEDFVRALPKGLDTQLGEKGSGLSEGQMQRIAIARAIYSGRPVLLLDECTSSLDVPTEQELLRKLRSLNGRTVLIVTHRPAALDIADQVVSF